MIDGLATALGARAGATRAFKAVFHHRPQRVARRRDRAADHSRWLREALPIETTIRRAGPGRTAFDREKRRWRRRLTPADVATSELAGALGRDVFSTDGRSLEEVVGVILKERALTIAAAESCTGGLFLSRLTDVPGSSAYVLGGAVVYSNQTKSDLVGVPSDLIAAHGAVSEPVAVALAEGVRARAGSDLGVGITGIAGPGGGSPAKPVGTVAIACARTGAATTSRMFSLTAPRPGQVSGDAGGARHGARTLSG